MKDQTQDKIKALATFLQCDEDDVAETAYDSFEAEGGEYLVLDDGEADESAREYIEGSLWAFNAEFIVENTALPWEAVPMIKSFQEEKCEDANETIRALITDMDGFSTNAISTDGRGHFLSHWDGEENEETINGEMYYIFRTN